MSRGGRNTKVHLMVANETTPILCKLSSGQAGDDPEGRILIENLPDYYKTDDIFLLMDRAYEGDKIRKLASLHGLNPVVPPKKTGSNLGIMIRSYTNVGMKLNVTSDG